MAFTAKILCSRCGKVVRVGGFIWGHRLRFPYAKKDDKGHYLGWNCDRCTDAIERGEDLPDILTYESTGIERPY